MKLKIKSAAVNQPTKNDHGSAFGAVDPGRFAAKMAKAIARIS